MRIDIHTHPILFNGDTYTPLDTPRKEKKFLKEMDRSGIDKAVLLPVDTIPKQLDTKLRDRRFRIKFFQAAEHEERSYVELKRDTQSLLELGMTNELVYRLCSQHPDRFIGFGSVNPARPESEIKETIDSFVDRGFRGIKLMPTLMFFNPEEEQMNIIYEMSQERGLVLLVHTGCDPEAWEHSSISEDAFFGILFFKCHSLLIVILLSPRLMVLLFQKYIGNNQSLSGQILLFHKEILSIQNIT